MGRGDVYTVAHKHKDGSYVNDEAREIAVSIQTYFWRHISLYFHICVLYIISIVYRRKFKVTCHKTLLIQLKFRHMMHLGRCWEVSIPGVFED